MDLIVHSDRAREIAETLAERMGQSVSDVVERALEDKLATLPQRLKATGLTPDEKVERVNDIHARTAPPPPDTASRYSGFGDEETSARKPVSREELLRQVQEIRQRGAAPVSIEEAVRRIRELRDEWED